MPTLRNFATSYKSAAGYLDLAANTHGAEKGFLVRRAIRRIQNTRPHVVEIGPGGCAAVSFLASQLAGEDRAVQLTLIEAPGVVSKSLARATEEFTQAGGTCVLAHGFAQDIGTLLADPVDVVSASALLHEVYSYGGGYSGLRAMMRTLPTVLRPNGFFVYRDVYAVKAPSLHERVIQSYDSLSWLLFLRMFVPQYLHEGTHPYHHFDDEMIVRQDSRIVPVGELDPRSCAFIAAPIGLFREIQRHYITLRDHVWRSGVLGFTPMLEGQLSNDWVDFRRGHKRVHYTLTDTDWLPRSQKAMLVSMSEAYADHYTIDGDAFDEVTDAELTAFLATAARGDEACGEVWASWLAREGHETYAYLTIDELLTAFAVNSADCQKGTVLVPVQVGDILRKSRDYYNRFLRKRLANPLSDAKQLVLFQNVPLTDTDQLRQALETVQRFCGKANLARVYTAINKGVTR